VYAVGDDFVSPQTSSVYRVVDIYGEKQEIIVAVRKLDEASSRVRIQGSLTALKHLTEYLSGPWGFIKDGDHLSIVIANEEGQLSFARGDVQRAYEKMAA
jgi:hypothetical protein